MDAGSVTSYDNTYENRLDQTKSHNVFSKHIHLEGLLHNDRVSNVIGTYSQLLFTWLASDGRDALRRILTLDGESLIQITYSNILFT